MNRDFVFRSGKYSGKTYGYVVDMDPQYVAWIKENRPEMLKEHKTKPKKEKEVKVVNHKEKGEFVMPFNMEFDNEPPEEICIPYMLQFPEKYSEQLSRFEEANKRIFRLLKEGGIPYGEI